MSVKQGPSHGISFGFGDENCGTAFLDGALPLNKPEIDLGG
jgi:hypothetical protein